MFTPAFSRLLLAAGLAVAALSPVALAQRGGGRPDLPSGPPGITLYSDTNLRGAAVELTGDQPNFNTIRFNDHARSIEVRGGVWLVCADGNYRGQCELLDASTGNLAAIGLNDKITSFRRYDVRREGPWRRPVVPAPAPIRDTRSGFEGEQSVFFPAPTYNGRRINDGSGAATRFCQENGFDEAVYKAPGPVLSDVLCR